MKHLLLMLMSQRLLLTAMVAISIVPSSSPSSSTSLNVHGGAFVPTPDRSSSSTTLSGKHLPPLSSRRISTTVLLATPQQPRQPPRRMLKKKRRRDNGRNRQGEGGESNNFPWETAESKPLVKSIQKESGQDYWMDEEELQAETLRLEAIKNRPISEGEIPKTKLWQEIKAPYQQNWIGAFSLFVMALSILVIKFPELLENPLIPIPDL